MWQLWQQLPDGFRLRNWHKGEIKIKCLPEYFPLQVSYFSRWWNNDLIKVSILTFDDEDFRCDDWNELITAIAVWTELPGLCFSSYIYISYPDWENILPRLQRIPGRSTKATTTLHHGHLDNIWIFKDNFLFIKFRNSQRENISDFLNITKL